MLNEKHRRTELDFIQFFPILIIKDKHFFLYTVIICTDKLFNETRTKITRAKKINRVTFDSFKVLLITLKITWLQS